MNGTCKTSVTPLKDQKYKSWIYKKKKYKLNIMHSIKLQLKTPNLKKNEVHLYTGSFQNIKASRIRKETQLDIL
jgi:hypothetical protein